MKSSIDKVRNRKKSETLTIDDINYGRVIAMQTYETSCKSIIKELIRLLVFNYRIEVSGDGNLKNCSIYSLKSSNRNDYNYIINSFRKSINKGIEVDLIRHRSFRKICLKIYILIKKFINFKAKNIDDSLISAITTTQYLILNYDINKKLNFEGLDLVCTFCDSYGPDNLIAQIANKKGIKTVTLQHGQYRYLSYGNEVADAEVYENFISDYMLTWGKATVDEFKKAEVDTNKLITVGALKEFSFNKRIDDYKKNGVFGVVLSGEYYKDTNVNMIKLANEIAEKYNLKYFLRFHPRNNKEFYFKYCNEKFIIERYSETNSEEYINKVDFSLIYMTGVFVELLSVNSPILIFKDQFLEEIFEIENYCIQNIYDFDTIYKNFLNDPKSVLDNQYSLYKYFNEHENVINNYKEAIRYICSK